MIGRLQSCEFERDHAIGRSRSCEPTEEQVTHYENEVNAIECEHTGVRNKHFGDRRLDSETCSSGHDTSGETHSSGKSGTRDKHVVPKVEVRDSDKENTNNDDPTERPFTKLLSLDERIDLLIAGERRKEEEEDAESRASVYGPPSLYTSTFTSITSDASETSDWYNRLTLESLASTSTDDVIQQQDMSYDVTTSDSASYWWDIGEKQIESRDFTVSVPYTKEVRRRIHLNLENDSSSIDELRNHRLASHLRSVQQARYTFKII